jgi:hypothetical protein
VDKADADAATAVLQTDAGIAGAVPPMPATDDSDHAMIQAVPAVDPSAPAVTDSGAVGSVACSAVDDHRAEVLPRWHRAQIEKQPSSAARTPW